MITFTIRSTTTLIALTLLHGVAWAETVDWKSGVTIDCPVNVATADQERTRTIVLPADGISNYALTAKSKDLTVKQGDRNALILRLSNPTFEGNLQVWDENSNLYTFLVRSPADGESPDDTLILKRGRLSGAGSPPSSDASTDPTTTGNQVRIVNMDTDGAAVHLMSQMVGGVTDPKIRWANVTTAERGGKITPGHRLHSDDNLTITLLRDYRSPTLFGYLCRLDWNGNQTAAFELQRWYRNGMICSFASDQVILAPRDPSYVIAPHRVIYVWYVTDAATASTTVTP